MSKKLLANVGNAVADNYRRYYQEYEGTFITATNKSEDDTLDTSRYIEVTEIWGNTVQDENNLEDIQSVGELYVDEQGEPILDDLGKEQYKIEIESCNCINLFNKSDITVNGADSISNIFIPVVEGEKITSTSSRSDGWMKFELYDINKIKKYSNFGNIQSNKCTITIPNNIHFIKPVFSTLAMFDAMTIRGDRILKYESFIPQVQNKTTILLPCQLQKVGNVYDRLYWDSEKGKYVVEKNVVFNIIDGSETFQWKGFNSEISFMYSIKNNYNLKPSSDLITSRIKYLGRLGYSSTMTFRELDMELGLIFPKGPPTEWETNTVAKYNKWIQEENVKIYGISNTSQLIETNITEKIQLPCYSEKTHIFVNSTVDATMKVLVPYKEII